MAVELKSPFRQTLHFRDSWVERNFSSPGIVPDSAQECEGALMELLWHMIMNHARHFHHAFVC